MSIDLFKPRVTIKGVNRIPKKSGFFYGSGLFTEITVTSETIDIFDFIRNAKIVPVIRSGESGVIIQKLNAEIRTVNPANFNVKKQLPASYLNSTGINGPFYSEGLADKIVTEQEDMRSRVDSSIELALARLVGTGTVTLPYADGSTFTIDYQVPAANKVTLTGDNVWGGSAADIIANSQAAKKAIFRKNPNGGRLTCVLGSNSADKFTADEAVLKLLDTKNVDIGKLQLDKPIEGLDYLGSFKGVDYYASYTEYEDETGIHPYVDPDAAIYFPKKDMFVLVFCAIAEVVVKNGQANLKLYKEKYFSKAWADQDPSALWVNLKTNPVPVLRNPEALYIITTG